jgi:hypothetical protein
MYPTVPWISPARRCSVLFRADGGDPFENRTQGRFAWIAEAIRLACERWRGSLRFHSVMAVVNANVDDSNAGRKTAMGIGGSWGQTNWSWCQKCQEGYGGNPFSSSCPAGG